MSPKKETNIILVVYLLAGVLLFAFGINPMFEKIQEKSSDLVLSGKESASMDTKIKNFEEVQKRYSLLEVEENLAPFFVSGEVDTAFIEFLESIAGKAGVSVGISRYAFGKEEGDIWSPRGYSVSCKGSFQGILQFIAGIENSSYLTEIQNFSLSRKDDFGSFDSYFIIKTYSK